MSHRHYAWSLVSCAFQNLHPVSILLFKLFSGCSIILAGKKKIGSHFMTTVSAGREAVLGVVQFGDVGIDEEKEQVNHTSATRLMHQIKRCYSGRQQKGTASMATVVIVVFLFVLRKIYES